MPSAQKKPSVVNVADRSPDKAPSPRNLVLMTRIIARLGEAGNSEVRRFGVNLHGSRVLIALLEHGRHRVGELSERVALDASTMSYLLKRLHRDGLITRSRTAVDSRSINVELTKAGRTAAIACQKVSSGYEAVLLSDFTKSEIALLRDFLQRMCASVEREVCPVKPRRGLQV